MNKVSLFMNTRIEGSGVLARIGDFALSPVRYFFHGRTVQIIEKEDDQHVHHVASYKGKGGRNTVRSKTHPQLEASPKRFHKALAMIVLFVPGLILGTIAKSFAYLSTNMKARHDLAKRHFTPLSRLEIGSEDERLDEAGIKTELQRIASELASDPLHQKVHTLLICGNGNVQFYTDPGFVRMNPKKVIMVGARIVNQPCTGTRLDDELSKRREWLSQGSLTVSSSTEKDTTTFVTQIKVSSVEEAMKHAASRRSFLSLKRYHAVYLVTEQSSQSQLS